MSTKPLITASDIQNMIAHWLGTPVGSYLGSDYGNDIKALLQNPASAGLEQALIAKMRVDVPIIDALPSGAISFYWQDVEPDKRFLVVDVSGSILVSDGQAVTIG